MARLVTYTWLHIGSPRHGGQVEERGVVEGAADAKPVGGRLAETDKGKQDEKDERTGHAGLMEEANEDEVQHDGDLLDGECVGRATNEEQW